MTKLSKPDDKNAIVLEPIGRLFARFTLPAIFSMLAVGSSEVIDGIFLGNYVGPEALAAVNLTLPFFGLVIAIGLMVGMGGNVRCGRYLGAGDDDAARAIFSKTVIAVIALVTIVSIMSLLFLKSIPPLLGANKTVTPLVILYLGFFLPFFPVMELVFILGQFLRLINRPGLAFFALLISAISNVILNWLFIVQFGFGVAGAAFATGVSYTIPIFIMIWTFFGPNAKLRLTRKMGKWNELIITAYNGGSEFVNESSIALVTLIFNWILMKRIGVNGVAAFAVVNYMLWFGLMITYGIVEATGPLISTNFGAKRPDRIKGLIKLSLGVTLLSGMLLASILLFIPEVIVEVFLEKDAIAAKEITMTFISVFWPTFLFNGATIFFASYFTAMHRPNPSMLLAILRSFLFPVMFILILPSLIGDKGIIAAIPAAEFTTFILALLLISRNGPHQLTAK